MMVVMNSFKQLFRKPAKAVLFFLLMAAATMLLVFGAALHVRNSMRLEALEGLYTTVGTVEQPQVIQEYGVTEKESYGESGIIRPEDLNFEGADYIIPPENRPYYLAYLENAWVGSNHAWSAPGDMLEFEVTGFDEEQDMVKAKVKKVLLNGITTKQEYVDFGPDSFPRTMDVERTVEEGQEISISRLEGVELEPGKRYVGYFSLRTGGFEIVLNEEGNYENQYVERDEFYYPMSCPHTDQVDRQGNPVDSGDNFPPQGSLYAEVTEDFYDEGGACEAWMAMLEEEEMRNKMYPVLPISDPDLLTFHRRSAAKIRGRMITDEEFETGARVCLVSSEYAQKNLIYEGSKVTLPLVASMYGYQSSGYFYGSAEWFFMPGYSLIGADGKVFSPFWEAEYEVVGVFEPRYLSEDIPFSTMFIIPQKSVEGTDEDCIIYNGAMHRSQTSFMIPNGTIESFDAALHEAVPQAEHLDIRYDDMGYGDAVESFEDSQRTAFLLFAVGLLAAVAIVALLMYFFIVVEKKRTAIERSLGLTKRQCRVSLMAGVMVLTLAAAALGSVGAGVLLYETDAQAAAALAAEEGEELEDLNDYTFKKDWGLGGIYDFSAKYSPWAMWDIRGNQAQLQEIEPPPVIFLLAPLGIALLVAVLALILIGRNLKVEPIMLLSAKN